MGELDVFLSWKGLFVVCIIIAVSALELTKFYELSPLLFLLRSIEEVKDF